MFLPTKFVMRVRCGLTRIMPIFGPDSLIDACRSNECGAQVFTSNRRASSASDGFPKSDGPGLTGPAERYVLMRTPLGVLRVSTQGRLLGGTPLSNTRF